MTVGEACAAFENMPEPAEVFTLIKSDPAFGARYEAALEVWAYAMADHLATIADDSTKDHTTRGGIRVLDKDNIQRSKLKISTRETMIKWANPKRFKDQEPATNTVMIAGLDENQVAEKLNQILRGVADRLERKAQQEAENIIDVTPAPGQDGDVHSLPIQPAEPKRGDGNPTAEVTAFARKVSSAPAESYNATMVTSRKGGSIRYETLPDDAVMHEALA